MNANKRIHDAKFATWVSLIQKQAESGLPVKQWCDENETPGGRTRSVPRDIPFLVFRQKKRADFSALSLHYGLSNAKSCK